MHDIVIPAKTLRRELWILLGCVAAAILTNAGAIIAYERPWTELFTQIGYTLVLAVGLYLLLAVVRLIVLLVGALVKRLRK